MNSPYFVHGKLHAPFFIFLRAHGRFADLDLLDRFGLPAYQPTATPPARGRYALVADDGRWTVVADDWYYTLWHMRTTRPRLAALGQECDAFACSVGDCDRSFDFVYYRDGRLPRKYVVAAPDFRGGRVVENAGEPLPGEAAAFAHKSETDIVLAVAASLGVRTEYAERELRVYAP